MLRTFVKYYLARLGLYSFVDLARRIPEIFHWLRKGCRGVAPGPVKRLVIAEYLRSHNLKQFIETGTHFGDTLAAVAHDQSILATSIELDIEFFRSAKKRFAAYRNVSLFHGDSGALMQNIVGRLTEPALFWLDGHYSGGNTSMGDKETPVIAELQAILQSPITGHVVLIDDVRCFDGTHDYPHLDQFLESIRYSGKYKAEISADILRLTSISVAR